MGQGYAVAINDSGQVAGVGLSGAFVWQNGRFTILGGGNITPLIPAAISPSGQVVGTMLPLHSLGPGGHAFLWQNGTITQLGSGFANGINAAGQIVGGTDSANQPLAARGAVGSSNSQAVLWQNGMMLELGPGYANAINLSGQIVGTSSGQAVLWQNGLKTILGPGIANAINDPGQVLGGTNPDPFLSNGAFLWQDGTARPK